MVDSSPVVLNLPAPFPKCHSSDSLLACISYYDKSSEERSDEQFNEEQEKTESDQDLDIDEMDDIFRKRLGSSTSILEAKNHAFDRVKEELRKAQHALELKDEQVLILREKMDHEIEELTASLFVEAHAMVREANLKQAAAEKKLREAQGKIDMLLAEVTALKTLVITSTPSMPLPPTQQSPKKSISLLKRHKAQSAITNKQMSMYSHHWRNPALLDAPCSLERSNSFPSLVIHSFEETKEADPVMMSEFKSWTQSPSFSVDSSFMKRVHVEDILPCLTFPNNNISQMVQSCVLNNSLCIEQLNGSPNIKKCALTSENRLCKYRLKLEDPDKWCDVCCSARNRITAVCNFFTYLRYIQQGLVKSDLTEMYWEIVRLRKDIALAKLSL